MGCSPRRSSGAASLSRRSEAAESRARGRRRRRADVQEIRAAAGHQPELDIALGGRECATDWDFEREHMRAVAAAGATWWTEWVKPGEKQRAIDAVRRDPLRAG